MHNNIRENSIDEGYGSDGSSSKVSNHSQIEKDGTIFQEKYKMVKVLNNSANGVIYEGFRILDNTIIVAKQVPKSKISQMVDFEGKMIPKEFHLQVSIFPQRLFFKYNYKYC